jgi:hypothetical protein
MSLVMTPVLRLAALGSHVEVRCVGESAELLAAAMRTAWSRCLVPGDAGPDSPVEVLEATLDDPHRLGLRLMLTTQDITRAFVRSQRGRLLMLHAGAVADPLTGRAVVYVAAGGTGKTTLSGRLGRHLGYLTDETVGIDETGVILPYPKPLSLRGDRPGLKDEVSPDTLGLVLAPAQPRVARVVLLDRRADAYHPRIEEVGFMDALFALTEQSSSLSTLDRPLQRMADLIDGAGPVLRVRYSEAQDVEHDLALLIGGTP